MALAHETVERLTPLVSPLTGIVPRLEPTESQAGGHVYNATHPFPADRLAPSTAAPGSALHAAKGRANRLAANRILGQASGAVGNVAMVAQAKASCLGEAIERYSGGRTDGVPMRRATLAKLGAAPPEMPQAGREDTLGTELQLGSGLVENDRLDRGQIGIAPGHPFLR